MPLTPKGRKIESAMEKTYGENKGEQVFYASKNKGTISGVEGKKRELAKKVKVKVRVERTHNERDSKEWHD